MHACRVANVCNVDHPNPEACEQEQEGNIPATSVLHYSLRVPTVRNSHGQIDWQDRASSVHTSTHHMPFCSLIFLRCFPLWPPGEAAEHATHRKFCSAKLRPPRTA